MSVNNADKKFENVKQIVLLAEADFNKLAKIHGAVTFAREASFALQALQNNEYLASIASGDQDSLKRAIINVAAVGLSLSPVSKLAYLVPRDKKVHLDISYRGHIQLAVDVGAIVWAVAEIVYEKDTYIYNGPGREPTHTFQPFATDRGEIVGGYCLAKTHSGEFILSQMPADEIIAIRDRSASFKAFKEKGVSTPWETDRNEMIKKTLIKRASKMWPMTDTRQTERFLKAIDVSNEADPLEFGIVASAAAPALDEGVREKGLALIRENLKKINRTEAKYIAHLTEINRREIKKLEDLTEQEIERANVMLSALAKPKEKVEVKNENAG